VGFVGNLLGFLAVKEVWKSVKNWQSYRHEFGTTFLGTQCMSAVLYHGTWSPWLRCRYCVWTVLQPTSSWLRAVELNDLCYFYSKFCYIVDFVVVGSTMRYCYHRAILLQCQPISLITLQRRHFASWQVFFVCTASTLRQC